MLDPLVQIYVGAMYFVDSKSSDVNSMFGCLDSYHLNVWSNRMLKCIILNLPMVSIK
jgi:hypothetical protein